MTETAADDVTEDELGQYARDLITLRRHARVIGRYLGAAGVPRGETTRTLETLVRAGVWDAYDDLIDPTAELATGKP